MKKFLFMLVFLTATLAANAQPLYKNEIAVGSGIIATSDLQSIGYRLVRYIMDLTADEDNPVQTVNSGCNSAEYFHYLGDLVAVGGVAAYHNFTVSQADLKTTFTSYNRDHFSSYSKLALGASLLHEVTDGEATNRVTFNGQITFLGIDTGWKRFRIFGEIGFGQQGLALTGLRYRF